MAHHQSAATALDAKAHCELQEITKVWRLNHPKGTEQEALLASVETTNATSFQEAVDNMHAILVRAGAIKTSACARR